MNNLKLDKDVSGESPVEITKQDNIQTGTIFLCAETKQKFIYCNGLYNKAALILWGTGEIKLIKAGTELTEYKVSKKNFYYSF
jgi:hypothetical protein